MNIATTSTKPVSMNINLPFFEQLCCYVTSGDFASCMDNINLVSISLQNFPYRIHFLPNLAYKLQNHRHSGRIKTVILAESVAALKKAETTLRHKHLAVLPTAKSQKSHYVTFENIIMNHNHMKKNRRCQIK